MNPIHQAYASRIRSCELGRFFAILDALDPEARRGVAGIAGPALAPQADDDGPSPETTDYAAFRARCEALAAQVPGPFLVHAVVSYTLSALCLLADDRNVAHAVEQCRSAIEALECRLVATPEGDPERAKIEEVLAMCRAKLGALGGEARSHRDLYDEFCDRVVIELLRQDRPGRRDEVR